MAESHEIITMLYLQLIAEHLVELILRVWIMLYSLTFHVILVNMCAVLEELPEVLEEQAKHSYLLSASKFLSRKG